MKVIIQIPCLDEEATLPVTLAELPRRLPGADRVEWLVVDDGSRDGTARVARELGVDHVVRHTRNLGLAAAFRTGLETCLERGADVIVNTDADAQYPGRYIPDLVAPILEGRADIVIGDRQTDAIPGFSRTKKLLQRLGSASVRLVSGTDVADAPSGFRAFSREAAMRLNVTSRYTYTLETIIQAGKKSLTIEQVPVRTNGPLRKSRLMGSIWQYVSRSAGTLVHLFSRYEPVRTLGLLSLIPLAVTVVLWGRYFILHFVGDAPPGTNVPSVVVGGVALLVAFLTFLVGLLADLLAMNRQIEEETLYYLKRLLYGPGDEDADAETRTDAGKAADAGPDPGAGGRPTGPSPTVPREGDPGTRRDARQVSESTGRSL